MQFGPHYHLRIYVVFMPLLTTTWLTLGSARIQANKRSQQAKPQAKPTSEHKSVQLVNKHSQHKSAN
jgi:hypothetical protein